LFGSIKVLIEDGIIKTIESIKNLKFNHYFWLTFIVCVLDIMEMIYSDLHTLQQCLCVSTPRTPLKLNFRHINQNKEERWGWNPFRGELSFPCHQRTRHVGLHRIQNTMLLLLQVSEHCCYIKNKIKKHILLIIQDFESKKSLNTSTYF
jgi:hypothetical protein